MKFSRGVTLLAVLVLSLWARLASAQCISPFAPFLRTGSGTISTSGTTVTGTGTAFLGELEPGFTIYVGDQSHPVASIESDTALTTGSIFEPALSGASFSMVGPWVETVDPNCAPSFILTADGRLGFNIVAPLYQIDMAFPVLPSQSSGNGIRARGAFRILGQAGGATTDPAGRVGGFGAGFLPTCGAGGDAVAGSTPGIAGICGLISGKGGSITGAGTGGTAGNGANAPLQAGDGGDATAGNIRGNGGNAKCQPGAKGGGAGTGGANGSCLLGLAGLKVPNTDGTAGQAMTTDGALTLDWTWVPKTTVLSSTSDTAINSVTEVPVLSGSVVTTSGKTLTITAGVKLINSSGAARTYTFQIRRGGTGCSDGTAVTDGDGSMRVADGDRWTHSYLATEASPSTGTQTYRLCVKSSNAGATQTEEYAQMTFTEF